MSTVQTVRTWGVMIKFSHSVFALPLALLATFLAARPALPTWTQLALIIVCMVGARSAAMTFNRIIDARIDARQSAHRQSPPPARHHLPPRRDRFPHAGGGHLPPRLRRLLAIHQ